MWADSRARSSSSASAQERGTRSTATHAAHVLAEKVRRRLGLGVSRRRLSGPRLEAIIRANGFGAKAEGREPGEVDVTSHYRSGTPGDWRTHFTDDHIKRFQAAYPTLLEHLGYAEEW